MPDAAVLTRPAHLWTPPHAVTSAGPDAVELAQRAGIDLDLEQQLALETLLGEDEHGQWATLENCIVEPRQNGKTVDKQVIVLYDLFVVEVRLAVWTAHLFPTAQEAFRDFDNIISGTPEFSRRVKAVSRANGEEGFEFFGDRRLNFRARSKTGGRGLGGDTLILDEAFAIGAAELGSLFPTMSARPNPHIIYGSSAGMIASAHLRSLRNRGRGGADPSLSYIEWCAPDATCATPDCDHHYGIEGCALDNEEAWAQANPAHPRGRITIGYLRSERRALPATEFARERLGWWEDPAEGESGIPTDRWAECADREAKIDEPCTLDVDVSPGHLSAAIVTCGGALHVTDHHAGTAWVVDRLVELDGQHDVSAIGLDPSGPAAALIPDLERAGFAIRTARNPDGKIVLLEGRQASQACESFLAAIMEDQLVHRDEVALNTAVEGADRRQNGDSWKWSRRSSDVDICPLVAATGAWFLWTQSSPSEPEVW